MPKLSPPFRADHVGSLLRPRSLLELRARVKKGDATRDDLRRAEDEAIREVVRRQEEVGLHSVTDGELRRTYFHVDFLERLDGVTASGAVPVRFKSREGEVDFAPPRLAVTGKLHHREDIQRADFEFLTSVTQRTPKVTIPSPTMVHFRGGRAAIDIESYPDLDEFFDDLARVYREEIDALYDAGARYIQLDDTNLAYLCDPQMREGARQRGDDPDELPSAYAQLINAVVDGRSEDLTIAVHMCRGNFQSAWVAEGSYEPVAEVLFNELRIDAFFLEYDDERSGDFAPLRFMPREKTVVLGLVTSKSPELETVDELEARVSEAARYVDLASVCLSPQCGFSSTVGGNRLTPDEQWAKLDLVVRTADRIWPRTGPSGPRGS